MKTTPSSSTLHFTSTTTSDGIAEFTPGHVDRPRSDQQVDAVGRARAAGERALVLGGGGGAGNAWEIGVIAGLFDAGLDVTEADLIIGTSAGSTAAAQITSATGPAELLASILAAAPQPRTGPVASDRGRVPDGPAADHMERTSAIIGAAEDAADMRRRMGAAALEMDAASGSSGQTQRRATVAARLSSQQWPQRPMLIVAVDAHTGEPVVFDRHSGVDLVDAASVSSAAAPILRRMSAASSAAPMIALVFSRRSAAGLCGTCPPSDPTGPVRGWGAAARMPASSSAGRVALVIWAADVDPADVPMIRSAPVTSSPASNRPAMTPISHALPAAPPPPRTNARSPAAGARLMSSTCWSEGVVFLGVAFREVPVVALPVATTSVARSWTAGEHPPRILRSWVSPPADGSRPPER